MILHVNSTINRKGFPIIINNQDLTSKIKKIVFPLTTHLITFLSIIFTNLILVPQSLDQNHGHDYDYDQFRECLIDQFERSNSATDTIYTPQNSTYTFLLLAQNLRSQSTSPLRLGLIVTPFHISEIQSSIFCSKKLNLQIRVKSGGHDYEGLSYTSSSPFVIVDLRNFRSITIDDDEKTAWVQVGATLGQLYYTISRKSKTLAFTAGVCPTVGVGGHFSGGGYGMLSRKHSIAADHIIDAKIINANGEVLDRSTMGEDLFWAIRGGGGTSFGIVLEFKVTLVIVPEIVTVFNVTRTLEENATELVHRWQYIADKVDESLVLRLFLAPTNSPVTGKRTVAASFKTLYLGRARDLLPLIKRDFPELGLVENDCMEMSWIESIQFFANKKDLPQETLRDRTPLSGFGSIYYKGKSDYVASPIPVTGLREMWSFLLEELPSTIQLQFSPYGGVMNSISESETPFPHRRGNIFQIHYAVVWSSLNQSEAGMDWIRRIYSFMARYVSKSPRSAYFNYRDLDLGRNNEGNTSYEQASVWGRKYFKNNFRRLVRVKTKVDPSNFFRNEQSIPPLL